MLAHLGGAHLLHQILAGHRWLGVDDRAGLRFADVDREDAAAHRALIAQVLHEGTGIDLVDRHNAAIAEPVEPPTLSGGRILTVGGSAHDHTARPDAIGFHRLLTHPVVPDVGVGEGEQLPGKRRIGDGLLVAGHAGGEHHLTGHVAGGTDGSAVEAGAVLKQEVRVWGHACVWAESVVRELMVASAYATEPWESVRTTFP